MLEYLFEICTIRIVDNLIDIFLFLAFLLPMRFGTITYSMILMCAMKIIVILTKLHDNKKAISSDEISI